MKKNFLNSFGYKILSQIIGELGPLPIQIDITNGCNLSCSHCYHSDHKNFGSMSYEQILNVIDQYENLLIKTGHQPYFILCGGEPLLSKHFLPLLNHISSKFKNTHISILTNGTLINSNLIQKISHIKNLSFQISLDGFTEATHDIVRGNGTFRRAIDGIKELKTHGYKVQTMTVLSKRTSLDIDGFFILGRALKVDGVCFTRFIPLGFGSDLLKNELDRPLTALEIKRTYQEIVIASEAFGVRSNLHQPLFNLLHSNLGTNSRYAEAIIVDFKGNLLLSSRSRYKIGNAFDEGLEYVFVNNPLLKALRKGEIEGCKSCMHFSRCGGDRNAAFAESGSFLKKDPGCWIATG